MKRKSTLILAVTITTIVLTLLVTISCSKSDWAVKIDDLTLSIDEFNRIYYTVNIMQTGLKEQDLDKLAADPKFEKTPLNKKVFMDALISQVLLYEKAKQDDSIDQDGLAAIYKFNGLQGASTYYIFHKFKDDIKVSDEEMQSFYNENKDKFKGEPINDEILAYIKQQIFGRKLQMKSQEYIVELLAEARVNREGFNKYLKEQNKAKLETTEPEKETESVKETVPAKTAPQVQK